MNDTMEPREQEPTHDDSAGIEEHRDSDSVEDEENSIAYEIEGISADGSLYSSLDDETSQIRLIYINEVSCGQGCDDASGTDCSIICCDLYKVSLDDVPDYAALSYVWGNSKQTKNICLGGRITPVTVNLANALKRLREMRQEFFWADAICINQDDIDERGQQVQLMEDIYNIASLVYAWLSDEKIPDAKLEHEDASKDTSEDAVSPRLLPASTWPLEFEEIEQPAAQSKSVSALDLAMQSLSLPLKDPEIDLNEDYAGDVGEEVEEIPNEDPERPEPVELSSKVAESRVDTGLFWCNLIFEQLEASKAESSKAIEKPPKIRRCDGLHALVNDAVFPVLDLLENKYWSRVWIFQEMVLADDITFLGPNTCLELSRFQAVCSWLQEIGDGDVLRPLFVELSIWTEWKKTIQRTDMMPLRIKRCKTLIEKIDRSKPKTSLAYAREEIFKVTRWLNATDPRDHIYGIIGVLDVRFKANYGRSVQDLYVAWTYWLAFSRPDLSFLNQAGFAQNKEHCYDLPSWVPDWSSIKNLRYGNSSIYADDKMKGEFRIIKKKSILIADGVEVSEVLPRRSDGKKMFLKLYNHLLSNGHPTGDPPLQVLFRTLMSDNTNANACRKGKFDHHNPKLLREFIAFATLLMNSDDEAFNLLEIDPLAWNPVSWAVNEYFGLPPRPADSREDRWNPLVSLYSGNDDYLNKGPDTGDAIVDEMLSEVLDVRYETFELLGDDESLMSIMLETVMLFRTLDGHIGRSGSDVQAGDKVCVLAGCRNPLVLRPVDDHFLIVEPCFVHGLMYGQVMQGVNESRYKMRRFEIR